MTGHTEAASWAAAQIVSELQPRHEVAKKADAFERFARDVLAENGIDVLDDVVAHIKQHATLTRSKAVA